MIWIFLALPSAVSPFPFCIAQSKSACQPPTFYGVTTCEWYLNKVYYQSKVTPSGYLVWHESNIIFQSVLCMTDAEYGMTEI